MSDVLQHTIEQDIEFLRDLAEDYGNDDDFRRLNNIADRLEEVNAIMPTVFAYVPMEALDRALDMHYMGTTSRDSDG